ncbi:hypothetical protein CLS_11270 [[Clostridium] cf. saccharolyticum K10]|nr:hypothetical protein CLS_11270 [[Clostridium] cf. saccharolyticum K10]
MDGAEGDRERKRRKRKFCTGQSDS